MLSQHEEKLSALTIYNKYFSMVEKGKNFYRDKKYDEAVNEFVLAILYKPELPDANFYMGKTLMALNMPERAYKSFTRVFNSAPHYVAAATALAELENIRNETKNNRLLEEPWKSLEKNCKINLRLSIQKYTSHNPSPLQRQLFSQDFDCQNHINGGLALSIGNNELAIAYYQQILKICPEDFSTLSSIGAAYLQLGQHPSALECLNKALALAPFAPSYFSRALYYYEIKEYLKAKEDILNTLLWANKYELISINAEESNKVIIRKLLSITDTSEPDLQPIDYDDGIEQINQLIAEKKYDEALALNRSLAHFHPGGKIYFQQAVIYFNMKNYLASRQAFSLAIWFDFDAEQSFLLRARVNILLGHAGCAVADLRDAIPFSNTEQRQKIHKDLHHYIIERTERFISEYKLDEAENFLKAMLFEINHPDFYFILSEILVKKQQYEEAKNTISAGMDLLGSNNDSVTHLKFAFQAQTIHNFLTNGLLNRSSGAESKEREAKIPDNDEQYTELLTTGKKYFNEKNYTEAEKTFEEAIKLRSELPDAYCHAGRAHEAQNNYEKALDYYHASIVSCPNQVAAITYQAMLYNKMGDTKRYQAEIAQAKIVKGNTTRYKDSHIAAFAKHRPSEFITTDPLATVDHTCDFDANLLGFTALTFKLFTVSLYYFNQAVKHYPFDFVALTYRGIIYFKLGDNKSALLDINKALEITPEFARAHFYRGLIHLKNNCDALAKEDFMKAIQYATDMDFEFFSTSYDRLKILQLISTPEPSIKFCNDDLIKNLQDIRQQIADRKDIPNAIKKLNALIYNFPEDAALYEARAAAHLRRDNEAARLNISMAIWLQKEKDILRHLYSNRSLVNLKLGSMGGALEDLRKVRQVFIETDQHQKIDTEFKKMVTNFTAACLKLGKDQFTEHGNAAKALHYFICPRFFVRDDKVISEVVNILLHLKEFDKAKALLEEEKEYMTSSETNKKIYASLLDKVQRKQSKHNETIKNTLPPEKSDKNNKKTHVKSMVSTTKTQARHKKSNNNTKFFAEALEKSPALNETLVAEEEAQLQEEKERQRKEKNKLKAKKKKANKLNRNTDQAINEDTAEIEHEAEPLSLPAAEEKALPDLPDSVIEQLVPKLYTLHPTENTIITAIKEYNKKSATDYLIYPVGGSVDDRVLKELYSLISAKKSELAKEYNEASIDSYLAKPFFNHVKSTLIVDDIDLVTEVPIKILMQLLKEMKPFESDNVPGLIVIDLGFAKVDIKYAESLRPLYKNANTRDLGVLYLTMEGALTDPNGFGVYDLIKGQLRTIIASRESMQNDPIRILRAINKSTKCQRTIQAGTNKGITKSVNLLETIPPGQINYFMKKLFSHHHAKTNYKKLWSYDIFNALFSEFVCLGMTKYKDWLENYIECTPSDPRLSKIYGAFIISAAMQASQQSCFTETILNLSEKIIHDSNLFKEAFSKYDIREELTPIMNSWKEHYIPSLQVHPQTQQLSYSAVRQPS